MSPTTRIALVLIVLLGLVVGYFSLGLRDRTDQTLCESLYLQARTRADSAVIDQREAPMERGRREGAVGIPTCGELRNRNTPIRR
jgi:hypothetical protein